jgi:hypothetical protein
MWNIHTRRLCSALQKEENSATCNHVDESGEALNIVVFSKGWAIRELFNEY